MQNLTNRKNAKFLFLAALLASSLTVGLTLTGNAADESPVSAPEAAATQPAATPRLGHRSPGDFARNHTKFLEDTKDLRRRIAVAEASMRAVMRSAQPDINLAQRFAGELFDLREQIRAKAAENGLPPMMGGKIGHHPHCRDGFKGHGMTGHCGPGMGRGPHHDGAPGGRGVPHGMGHGCCGQ